MKTVSIRDAKNRLTELARAVENGQTIVVTRNGLPVLDLVPHEQRRTSFGGTHGVQEAERDQADRDIDAG